MGEDEDITVWENKMLKPFATLISCRDTIHSECQRGLSLDQCVQVCRDSPFCSCGYYLEPSYGGKSYCAPLNSVLLKNMNLHWNIYDHDTDPTKHLWKKTAVFFRPKLYPPQIPDDTLLMQRDICAIYYVSKQTGKSYYLQEDLKWRLDGDQSSLYVLFIDKFPQFYELANNIQNQSNFVLKIFSKPEVLAIKNNKLDKIPYLSIDPERKIPDTYMYMEHQVIDPTNDINYPVLTFSSKFQILTEGRTNFLGINSDHRGKTLIEMSALPWDGKDPSFTGYFQVIRKAIQPNIYKVAEILPARLTFLENSIDFFTNRRISEKVILIVCIILLVVMVALLFWPRKVATTTTTTTPR